MLCSTGIHPATEPGGPEHNVGPLMTRIQIWSDNRVTGMCSKCNYSEMLQETGIKATTNRVKLLEAIGNHRAPVSANGIHRSLKKALSINRVTVYRILDLLVEAGLIDRLSSGGPSFFYGLAPNEHHQPHAHFYCKECRAMNCLDPESLELMTDSLNMKAFGHIDKIEVRLDGVCKKCSDKTLAKKH